MVTGQNHALVQHNRPAFTGIFHFRVARDTAGSGGGTVNVAVNQTELQRRRGARISFRPSGILNTRQFNHDTVRRPDAVPAARQHPVG
ncbi:Uncharacterised protein [Raoultella planticola]|uniref:Uncharacterized protein n=1 Tax=Raoultella planticola TaxID=575 RepID=A0A485AUH4_RAOPL|nr:Uncharacterised protein [Raoultella planticola]